MQDLKDETTSKRVKASRKAERKYFQKMGGRLTPMSGAGAKKGDGTIGRFSIDLKTTENKTFRLTKDLMALIDKMEANNVEDFAALVIETSEFRAVVLSHETFERILDEINSRSESSH